METVKFLSGIPYINMRVVAKRIMSIHGNIVFAINCQLMQIGGRQKLSVMAKENLFERRGVMTEQEKGMIIKTDDVWAGSGDKIEQDKKTAGQDEATTTSAGVGAGHKDNPEVTALLVQVGDYEQGTALISIGKEEDYDFQLEVVKKVIVLRTAIDDKRKKLKKPFSVAIEGLDAFFKEPIAKLKVVEEKIKAALTEYKTKQETAARELETKLAGDAITKKKELEKEAGEFRERGMTKQAVDKEIEAEGMAGMTVTVPKKKDGASGRTTWHYEVIDESKVPRTYLMPDDKKLKAQAAVSQNNKDMAVAGIRFYSKTGLAIRTKTRGK